MATTPSTPTLPTFTWVISSMDRQANNGFVSTVHYRAMATEGEYTVDTYGTVGYTHESDGTYIPYADLTEEDVISWVQDSLGKEVVEERLQTQINALKAPTQKSGLPW